MQLQLSHYSCYNLHVYGRNGVHIPFLDSVAKYNFLFGYSLPLTLINERARSIAVSTANSCVIGGDFTQIDAELMAYLKIPA